MNNEYDYFEEEESKIETSSSLMLLSGSIDDKLKQLEMLDSYISVPSILLDKYVNRVITVLGAVIEDVPEATSDEGVTIKAYKRVLIKIDSMDEDGNNIIIRSMSKKTLMKAQIWQEHLGLGNWEKPIKMQVILAGKEKMLRIVK